MLNPRPLLSSKSFLYFTCRKRERDTSKGRSPCGSLSDRTRSIFDVLPYLARPRLSRRCTKTNASLASAVEHFHAYACYFQCTSVFTLTRLHDEHSEDEHETLELHFSASIADTPKNRGNHQTIFSQQEDYVSLDFSFMWSDTRQVAAKTSS